MPFIDAKISKKLTEDEMTLMKTEFGKAIALFPGKTENWLMCDIQSDQKIWFQGNDDAPSAFVEVKLFGAVDGKSADQFTKHICGVFESSFGVPAERVYVRYEGGTLWGWNGGNF